MPGVDSDYESQHHHHHHHHHDMQNDGLDCVRCCGYEVSEESLLKLESTMVLPVIVKILIAEVRRLRDELQIEKSTNDYLDDAKEKIAVMNCDLKNNADDLKDEIQRLRKENAQLKHDAETVMNDYQDLSRLCATDAPLIALGKAVEAMPTGQALVNDEIHGWSVIKDEHGNVREPAKPSPLEALLAAEAKE